MPSWFALEPNPARDRALTVGFLNARQEHLESHAAIGRHCGLLETHPRGVLARKIAPEVIGIEAVHAVGERGHLILADPAFGLGRIRPLDLQALHLGPGVYPVYAALTGERVPCGDLLREPPSEDLQDGATFPSNRHPRVRLVVGDERRECRDWFQIAEIRRERVRGGIHTELNESFHPRIVSMGTYQRVNPIVSMVEPLLNDLAGEAELQAFRNEALVLQSIAEHGSCEAVFLQLQRLAISAPREHEYSFLGRLVGYRYQPDRFCDLLEELSRLRIGGAGVYPRTLELDGKDHSRLPGEFEFVAADDCWRWDSSEGAKQLNTVALYFPQARSGDLPQVIWDTQSLGPAQPVVAELEHRHSHAGVVLTLADMGRKSPVREIFLSEMAGQDRHRLRSWLNNGHALYYR